MEMLAAIGIEPLIIIGVIIGSAILQAIAKRKQDRESWDEEWDSQSAPPVAPPARPPRPEVIPTRPPTIPKLPPRNPPPLVYEQEGPGRELTHFEQSQVAYERASNLQRRVHDRFAEIDRRTERHVPTASRSRKRPESAELLLKSFRKPETIRQAFLASFVLNPPKALE
jgi:hypothetical protein